MARWIVAAPLYTGTITETSGAAVPAACVGETPALVVPPSGGIVRLQYRAGTM